MERYSDACAHPRTAGIAHSPGQGDKGVCLSPQATTLAAQIHARQRQIRRRDRQLQRAPHRLPRNRLAQVCQLISPGAPGHRARAVHHADFQLRQSRRAFRRGEAHLHDYNRPRPRLLAIHLDGIFQAEDQRGGSRLVGNAPQGESHRLRELGGEPRHRGGNSRPPRRQTPGVAPATRPHRLHRDTQCGSADGSPHHCHPKHDEGAWKTGA